MGERSKHVKIKAYINPEIVNHNLLNGSWKLVGNGLATQNVGKILINPNFKRNITSSTSGSSLSCKPSNLVHVNPNFLNGQKKGFAYVQNEAVFRPRNESSLKNDLNLTSSRSNKCNEKITECKIEDVLKKEENVNNRACASNVCDTETFLNTTGNSSYNVAAAKTSLYSWRKNEINKSDNVQPKSHFSKNVSYFGNHNNLLKESNKFIKVSYKHSNKIHASKASGLQLRSQFKYIKERKLNNLSQTPTKATSPFLKKSSPIYASRTKLINSKLSDSQSKAKINSDAQRFLQMKKNLQLLKLKILNTSKLSPTVKFAASVRAKYIYNNKLPKNRLYVKQDKTKFKLDKRKKLDENAKLSSVCKRRYKIEKLFPSSIKIRNNSWNKSFNLWTKENFNPSLYLWKNKQVGKNLKNIAQCYPNRTVVKIGGIWYKSSQSKLTRTKGRRKSASISSEKPQPKSIRTKLKGNHVVYVRGEKFILDKSGKSLRRHPDQKQSSENKQFKNIVNRVDLGGVTYLRKSNNILIRTNTHHARYVVNHAKHKSIALLSSLRKRNNMPCMIYSRLGKCPRHSKGLCSYNHDRKNVILCKKFLKNECNDSNCLLSHEVVQEKMATCHFFLKGCCNNENCSYLHVKVNSKAPICKNFLQGFCSSGKDCMERHVYACPEFDKNGKCSRGDKCLYPHRSKSKSDSKVQKSKTWTKNKGKSNVVRKNKIKNLEVIESKGSQDLETKRPKRSLLMPKGTNLTEEKKSDKNLDLSSLSNVSDIKTSENIEFIPKRVKLESLPCFIPLDSSHGDT